MPRKKSTTVHRAVSELLLGPKDKDVLDDDVDGTAARTEKDQSDADAEDDDALGLGMGLGATEAAFDFAQERSGLRGKTSKTLDEKDAKYVGKKVSRKDMAKENEKAMAGVDWKEQESAEWGDMLMGGEDDEEEEEEEDEEEGVQENGAEESEEEEEGSEEEDPEDEEIEHEGDHDNDDDVEGEEEEEDDDFDDNDDDINLGRESDEEMETSTNGGIELFSHTDVAKEVSKGRAIRKQLLVSERLLECRIQMQKMLSKVNQMPQHDTFKEFKSAGDDQHRRALKRTQNGLKSVLDELVTLQTDMINGNEDVKSAFQNEDDEEEEELEPCAKKQKLSEYSALLSSRNDALQPWRDSTIQLWNERTRMTAGVVNNKSFSGFESSTLKQIEHILSDKERLYKRARTKRSAYNILGKSEEMNGAGQEEETPAQHHQVEIDAEIFDDDDFYHQLLRDLIDRKAADSGQLGEQWQQIQKMRSKLKRKVDTRASKGRKTRYDIHAKIVNFMAPVYVESWADETKNELFGCLFGKND